MEGPSKNELSRRLLDLQKEVGAEHKGFDSIEARIERKGRTAEDERLIAESYRNARDLRG
jgi:hypothetical protein